MKDSKGLNEQDKLTETTVIQAQLNGLDCLSDVLDTTSSVSKAVQ